MRSFCWTATALIRNWNKGARKIKGYTEEEAVGMNFRMFYRPEDREAGLPEQLIETGSRDGKGGARRLALRKDGSAFWGSVLITAPSRLARRGRRAFRR